MLASNSSSLSETQQPHVVKHDSITAVSTLSAAARQRQPNSTRHAVTSGPHMCRRIGRCGRQPTTDTTNTPYRPAHGNTQPHTTAVARTTRRHYEQTITIIKPPSNKTARTFLFTYCFLPPFFDPTTPVLRNVHFVEHHLVREYVS